jgi:hypothetical protein
MNRDQGSGPDIEEHIASFAELARQIGPPLTARQRAAGWQRLRQAMATHGRQVGPERMPFLSRLGWLGRSPRRLGLALSILVVAAAALPVGWRWSSPAGRVGAGVHALEFVVSEGEPSSRPTVESGTVGQVISSPTGSAQVRFTDGSRVTLGQDARLTVVGLTPVGAEVRLLDGVVEVDVRHRSDTAWTFEAGPYAVRVEGTSFELGWDAANRRLSLKMHTGRVALGPPAAGRPWRSVVGGEAVFLEDEPSPAGPAAAEARLPGAGPGSVPPTPPAVAGSTVESRVRTGDRSRARGGGVAHRSVGSGPRHASWASLLSKGAFEAIVAEATESGIEVSLAAEGEQNLAALADAARYTHRADLARQTLLALRARFPTSSRARDAAFFLARIDETARQPSEAALDWYARYLEESPRGSYAEEALGRQMILLGRRPDPDGRGVARARSVASRYLEQYPRGLYSGEASGLLRDPAAP